MTEFPSDWWTVMSAWWSGRETTTLEICSMTMLWWGRMGKLCQFFGALTVILDIVGPDRLNKYARRFRISRPFDRFWAETTRRAAASRVFAGVGRRAIRPALVFLALASLLLLVAIRATQRFADETLSMTAAVVHASVDVLTVLGMIFLVCFVISILLEPILSRVRPLDRMLLVTAFLIERSGNRLRALAILAIVVGFHFDLLSS